MCVTLLIPVSVPNLINLTFNILTLEYHPKKKTKTTPTKVPHQAFIYEEQEVLRAQFNVKITILYHCFDTKDDLVQLGHW